MNFLNNKSETDKLVTKGYNVGVELLKKIPVKLQQDTENSLYILAKENASKPQYQGVFKGFQDERMREMAKRMEQLRKTEIEQLNQKSKGRLWNR